MNWNRKLNEQEDKELKYLKAIDEVDRKDENSSFPELNMQLHNTIFKLYPNKIRNACKYPQCDLGCYFGDRQELCPSKNIVRYESEMI